MVDQKWTQSPWSLQLMGKINIKQIALYRETVKNPGEIRYSVWYNLRSVIALLEK